MKTRYRVTDGGAYVVTLQFRDTDCTREPRLGVITRGHRTPLGDGHYLSDQWRFEPDPAADGGAWDCEPIERGTFGAVRVELEAQLFIALMGKRDR